MSHQEREFARRQMELKGGINRNQDKMVVGYDESFDEEEDDSFFSRIFHSAH